MATFLSIDDLFTAGLGFDLAGACLLGVGLLASGREIAQRTGTFPGYNAAEAVSLARSKVAGAAGFLAIALGFVCQAVAYVALVSGAATPTSGRAALAAGLAAALAVAISASLWLLFRDRALRRFLVEVAHYDPTGRRRLLRPSMQRLGQYAAALGELPGPR